MASVTCPFCGTEAKLRQFFCFPIKPFCTNCGWNLDRAQNELGKKARDTWIVGGIFVFFLVAVCTIAARQREFYAPLGVLLAFGILFLVQTNDYWTTKREIETSLGSGKGNPSLSGRAPLPSTLIQEIQSLSQPRRIRLSLEGRVSVLLFVMALAIFAAFAFVLAGIIHDASLTGMERWPLVALLIVIAAVLASLISFKILKEWRNSDHLLRFGEVIAANVVEQKVIHYGRYSMNQITYEFSLPHIPLIRKTERDQTKKIFEDMLIPVFYDPASPNNCTALCSTYYRFPDAET
jgi:NADH:ubiquinone oxidoreductase subunit 6 (subunit J)